MLPSFMGLFTQIYSSYEIKTTGAIKSTADGWYNDGFYYEILAKIFMFRAYW